MGLILERRDCFPVFLILVNVIMKDFDVFFFFSGVPFEWHEYDMHTNTHQKPTNNPPVKNPNLLQKLTQQIISLEQISHIHIPQESKIQDHKPRKGSPRRNFHIISSIDNLHRPDDFLFQSIVIFAVGIVVVAIGFGKHTSQFGDYCRVGCCVGGLDD